MCITRDSEPLITNKDTFAQRPVPGSDGNCADGYKVCNGGAEKQYRTCQPSSKSCPVVDVLKVGSAERNGYTKVSFGDGQFFQVSTEGNTSLPLVYLESYAAQLGRDDGGRCYANSPSRGGYSGESNTKDYTNQMPGNCGTGDGEKDTRYSKVDEYRVSDWLTSEFQLTSACAGKWGVNGKGTDTRSNSMTCTGVAKNSAGSGNAIFGDSDCALQGQQLSKTTSSNCNSNVENTNVCSRPEYNVNFQSHGCKSDDELCKGILFQTKCGKYARFAAQASNSYFGLYREGQIEWKADCSADYKDMSDSQEVLDKAVTMLGHNFGISVAGNIICGIIISIIVILHNVSALTSENGKGDLECIPGDGTMEAQTIDACNSCLGPMFTIAKVTCSALAYVYIGGVKGMYTNLKDDPCSDEVTNYTTGWLGTTLPSVYSSIQTNFVIEVIMFLYTVYHIYCIIRKCCAGTFGKPADTMNPL